MSRLLVVGAGMAGIACAWAGRRAGFEVTVLDGGSGATALGSGALDLSLAHDAERELPPPLRDEWKEFVKDLGFHAKSEADCRVATCAGITRRCAYRDPSLLELSRHAGGTIGVAALERPEWEPERICRSLSDDAWSSASRTKFVPWPFDGIFEGRELGTPLPVFSRVVRSRQEPLREALLAAKRSGKIQALLLGPWLGNDGEQASSIVGSDGFAGEVVNPPEGGAGARLIQAGHRFLAERGVAIKRARAVSIAVEGQRVRVVVRSPAGESVEQATACVLATGGLLGGGRWLSSGRRAGGTFELELAFGQAGSTGSQDGIDPLGTVSEWLLPGSLGSFLDRECPAPWESDRVRLAGDVSKGSPQTLGAAIVGGLWAVKNLSRAGD